MVDDRCAAAEHEASVRSSRGNVICDLRSKRLDYLARKLQPLRIGWRLGAIRQLLPTAEGAEALLALLAMADAVVNAAVVPLGKSKPVEEEAINRVAVDHLIEDVERAMLVVVGRGTSAEQRIVDLRLSARRHEQPFWVLLRNAGGDL